jgi:FtsP/CotA-like multicopper oxidase with cupredoxin domain
MSTNVRIGAVLTLSALSALSGCSSPDESEIGSIEQKSVETPQVPLDGATVPKYVDAVPTFSGRRSNGSTTQQIRMSEFQQRVLPAAIYAGLPAPFNAGTFVWGYGINQGAPSWPAVTIEAHQGNATTAIYTNAIQGPNGTRAVLSRYLTIDQSLHWADPLGTTHANDCMEGPPLAAPCLQPYTGPIPTTVHLHGAEVLSAYDGHPDTWFTPGNTLRGPAFVTNTYNYPNRQEATTLWFHDHALGITRLNVYSGLAGFYLLRDNRDTGLANNPIGLPAGNFEQELMIQDRQFDTRGQILFPDGTPPDNPTGINGPPPNPDVHPFWNPEFFGDVIVVNGKSWPFLRVEPRRYRFRFVDASNARFYNMQLRNAANNAAGPAIWQIGSDGGLLNAPVRLANPANPNDRKLLLAPAERADVIIDFAGQAGRTFILTNDANGPFPGGDPPDPNTSGQIMQFRVNLPLSSTDTSFNPANPQRALRASPIVNIKPTPQRPADRTRDLILVEMEGEGGPLGVLLNNSHWHGNRQGTDPPVPIPGSISNGKGVLSTENPQVGATEIWEVANLSEDAHPIHIHLIQFQIINRQDFDRDAYRAAWDATFPGGTFGGETFPPGTYIPGFGPPRDYLTPNAAGAIGGNLAFTPFLQGTPTPPAANEAGWMDTVVMPPLTITRIAARWAPQAVPVANVRAGQDLFPFDPTTGGPGYAWHCHILDHEDNEMMRPYLVRK